MDRALLGRFCEDFYQMHLVSVRIYEKSDLIRKYEIRQLQSPVNEFFEGILCDSVLKQKKNFIYSLAQNFMDLGCVYNAADDITVLIGPVRTNIIVEQDILGYVRSNTDGENAAAMAQDVYSYLKSLPVMNRNRLLSLIDLVHCFLNGTVEEVEYEADTSDSDGQRMHRDLLSYRERIYFGDQDPQNTFEKEKRMLFFVKTGAVDEIKYMMRGAPFRQAVREDTILSGTLRQAKNNCITGIALVSRAALDAGLNAEMCDRLADMFVERTELCHNSADVWNVRTAMLITFTEQVANLHAAESENPIIRRVIAYINDNIENKITCSDICGELHMGRTYLSTCFKKETGMGVVDYINLQKVTRAKQMLKYTDKPLVQISNALSFSSQAYFQKIFKDVTGITPLEYRNNPTD